MYFVLCVGTVFRVNTMRNVVRHVRDATLHASTRTIGGARSERFLKYMGLLL